MSNMSVFTRMGIAGDMFLTMNGIRTGALDDISLWYVLAIT